jgi:hypothetical protein
MSRSTRTVLVLVLLAVILAAAQACIHRARREPGGFHQNFDEGSHFTTALMIRDYVLHGLPANPVAFAKTYYLHYPKVSFGSWPPLFHIALGLWMIVAPATHGSAIFFVSLLTGLLAILAFRMAQRGLPPIVAIAVALAVWLAETTQVLTRAAQADTQYSLLSALAVYLFADYVTRPDHQSAFWFGAACFGALLTKNNAMFIAISGAIVLLMTSRWSILRRLDLWVAVLPAVLAFGAWQWLTLPFVRYNMKGVTGESTPGLTLFVYGSELLHLIWPALLPFVLFGIWKRIGEPRLRGKLADSTDAASLGLLLGPCLFHAMLPHDVNQRYLLPSLVALLIFAAYGIQEVLSLVRLTPALRVPLTAAILCIPALAVRIPPDVSMGYSTVAAALTNNSIPQDPPSMLIVSSFGGEANLVAEIASREARPGHWLLRSYKILRRHTGRLNRQTELVTTDPEEMLAYLQDLPVSLIVIADDGEPKSGQQVSYTRAMVRAHPDLFTAVLREPVGAHCLGRACAIEVYRLNGGRRGPFDAEKLPKDMPLWKGL